MEKTRPGMNLQEMAILQVWYPAFSLWKPEIVGHHLFFFWGGVELVIHLMTPWKLSSKITGPWSLPEMFWTWPKNTQNKGPEKLRWFHDFASVDLIIFGTKRSVFPTQYMTEGVDSIHSFLFGGVEGPFWALRNLEKNSVPFVGGTCEGWAARCHVKKKPTAVGTLGWRSVIST